MQRASGSADGPVGCTSVPDGSGCCKSAPVPLTDNLQRTSSNSFFSKFLKTTKDKPLANLAKSG